MSMGKAFANPFEDHENGTGTGRKTAWTQALKQEHFVHCPYYFLLPDPTR